MQVIILGGRKPDDSGAVLIWKIAGLDARGVSSVRIAKVRSPDAHELPLHRIVAHILLVRHTAVDVTDARNMSCYLKQCIIWADDLQFVVDA
jgi:hypothetical protein